MKSTSCLRSFGMRFKSRRFRWNSRFLYGIIIAILVEGWQWEGWNLPPWWPGNSCSSSENSSTWVWTSSRPSEHIAKKTTLIRIEKTCLIPNYFWQLKSWLVINICITYDAQNIKCSILTVIKFTERNLTSKWSQRMT